MSREEMYRFNEDAVRSKEMQAYLDLVFQNLIDELSDRINEELENGMTTLSYDLNAYARSKGFVFTEGESVDALVDAFPGFRGRIHDSIERSTIAYQQQLLGQAE